MPTSTPVVSSDTVYNTVKINGELYSIKNVVGYRNLARFENRVVIGDPSKDDDDLLSTKVWSDFSGGCGVFDEKEGADTGTFWDSEGINIDHPSQLVLGPLVQSFTISGTNAFVLGESGNVVHFSFDLNIYQFNEAGDTITDTTYDLAFGPVNKPVAFNGSIYVPQGANGYQTFIAGSGVTAGVAGITATAFAVWDNKLIAIEHNRQLSIYDPVTAAWTSPTTAILEAGQTPRDVIVYYNRSDEPTIYVMTTDCLWGYDDVTQTLKRTNVILPRHPDNGRGLTVWRTGETLYLAASMGVYAWTGPGGTLAPMGLDRKHGIPIEYQGKIVDLSPALNHMYCLVQAQGTGTLYHSLYRYNGNGWCRMWANANKTDAVNWSMVTGAANVQRVFWDCGNKIYSMELPRAFSNPRELILASAGNYGASGSLTTSWFDANFPNFNKWLDYITSSPYYTDSILGGGANDITFAISYQKAKTATSWTSLGVSLLNVSSNLIRLNFYFSTSTATKSAMLDSSILKYIKIPTSYGTWQITFDMDHEGQDFLRDPQKVSDDLEALLVHTSSFDIEIQGRVYRARCSNLQGWDSTGEDRRKSRTATFVEVPYYAVPAYSI